MRAHADEEGLPGRSRPCSNTDRGLLTFGDDHERALDLDIGRSKGIDDVEHKRCGDVARSQVDDPDELHARSHHGPAEGEIMRDHDSTLSSGDLQDLDVRPTDKRLVPNRADIVPPVAETDDDVGSDVLVCEERKVEWFHAVMRRSHERSPRRAFAA